MLYYLELFQNYRPLIALINSRIIQKFSYTMTYLLRRKVAQDFSTGIGGGTN
jgi:hypothetical protein